MATETHQRDPLIDRAEKAETERLAEDPRVASLFDVRFAIGGLFILWGLVLTWLGLFGVSADDLRKSVGVNINLWLGIAMLVLGALFVLWGWLLPVVPRGRRMERPRVVPSDSEDR